MHAPVHHLKNYQMCKNYKNLKYNPEKHVNRKTPKDKADVDIIKKVDFEKEV